MFDDITCLLVIIIIIILLNTHAHGQCTYHTRMREDNGQRTDEGIGTVIASIDTVLRYTSHPHVIRAYCSLRALLRLRGVLPSLRNGRPVLLEKFLAPLFRSRNWQLETKTSDKLSEVSGAPLDVATNTPLAFNKNARAVLVPNRLRGKVIVDFWQFSALPDSVRPFPDRRSVEGGNLLLVFADSLDGVLLVHCNTHFPPLMRALIVDC